MHHPNAMSDGCPGTPREGFALLLGLVICGKCGRRMSPRYHGNGGHRVAYECNQGRKQNGSVGICWSVAGGAINTAVEAHVLEAITSHIPHLVVSHSISSRQLKGKTVFMYHKQRE